MQIKFLTVALATALTATLTGCGSDGDSNYNKQDVAPINFGDADSTEVKKLQTDIDELTNKLATSKKESTETVKKLEERLQEALNRLNELAENTGSSSTGSTPTDDNSSEGSTPKNPETEQPTNTEGSNPTNPEGGNPTNTDTAQPTKPVVKDPVHNVNNAAHEGSIDDKEVVVVQNYVRGASAEYDRTPNPKASNNGNASVIGYNTLDNPAMSNIVLARPEKNGSKKTIFVGTDAEDAKDYNFNKNGELDLGTGIVLSLQNHNISEIDYNTAGNREYKKQQEKSAGYVKQIYTEGSDVYSTLVKNNTHTKAYVVPSKFVTSDYNASKNASSDIPDESITFETQANVDGGEGLNDFSKEVYKSGLVRTFSVGEAKQTDKEFLGSKNQAKNATRFIVRGQEEQILNPSNKSKVDIRHQTGFEQFDGEDRKGRGVRMFGSLYHAVGTKLGSKDKDGERTLGDVPEYRWDSQSNKFVTNSRYQASKNNYLLSEGTPNSWQFDAKTANAAKAEINGSDGLIKTGNARQTALFRANLTPKPIHLNHVQYGRVTIDADKASVDDVLSKLDDKTLAAFTTAAPFMYTQGKGLAEENKKFTTVNSYFARGNWATQPNEMPSEGKVTYLGHALAYGLDNSLHKGHNLNSNTVTLPKRQGIGNFVRAEADFATSKVTGSIYNVWTPDLSELGKDAIEDTLVTFDGNITKGRNSVVGTSKLAYGNQEEGAFKGAFYGPKAVEFAGSVNSVTEGYGPAKWGAVFGAKRGVEAAPTTGIDSSIEATAGAGN